jgi:hypothetical protein
MTQNFSIELDQSVLEPQFCTQPIDFHSALLPVLSKLLLAVCTNTEWEYGESWMLDTNYNLLELSPAWCVNMNLDRDRVNSWMQFQVCSKAFVLQAGEGLPGRVWQSQKFEWIDDVSVESESYFLRNQIARALSVKAGCGIPIVMNSRVLAVVVFFMSKARSQDQQLIENTQSAVANVQLTDPLVKEMGDPA